MLPFNKAEQFEVMVLLARPMMAKGNSWDLAKWDTLASPAPMGPYSQMLQTPFVFHLFSCSCILIIRIDNFHSDALMQINIYCALIIYTY